MGYQLALDFEYREKIPVYRSQDYRTFVGLAMPLDRKSLVWYLGNAAI